MGLAAKEKVQSKIVSGVQLFVSTMLASTIGQQKNFQREREQYIYSSQKWVEIILSCVIE